MSIFSRIFKIGQAKINNIVDGLEKPETMLEQAIRDKTNQIREAKKSIQQCIATARQAKATPTLQAQLRLRWILMLATRTLHGGVC